MFRILAPIFNFAFFLILAEKNVDRKRIFRSDWGVGSENSQF